MARPKKAPGEDLIATGFRFSPTCRRLLKRLAEHEGLGETAYLEMTVRRLAREKNLDFDEKKLTEP